VLFVPFWICRWSRRYRARVRLRKNQPIHIPAKRLIAESQFPFFVQRFPDRLDRPSIVQRLLDVTAQG
jgi:hypothetical protein